MFGNLSIRPRMVGLPAVPVAAAVLLGGTAAAAGWGERARGGEDGLAARRGRADRALSAYRAGAAAIGPGVDPALDQALAVAAGRLDRLALLRAKVDRRLATTEQASADHDRLVAGLLWAALELARRLDAPASARSARLLLAVAAAKEATGRERSLLAATPAGVRSCAGHSPPGSSIRRNAATSTRTPGCTANRP